MPRAPPTSRRALLAPEAMPCSCGPDAGHDQVGGRGEVQGHPDAADDQRGQLGGVRDVRRRRPAANQPRPTAWRASPAATTGRPPIRSERIAGDRRDEHRHAGPGQHPQRPPRWASSRATPCMNWLSRKIEPNMPRNISRLAALIAGEGAGAEEPHRQHRVLGADAVQDERRRAGPRRRRGRSGRARWSSRRRCRGPGRRRCRRGRRWRAGCRGCRGGRRCRATRRGAAGRAAAGPGRAGRSARRSSARRRAR